MYSVMLVDDEPAIIDGIKRTITRKLSDIEVVAEAYSVDKAIKEYNKYKPDIILTDMKMPEKSGIELIKYIAELEESSTICVAVSGYTDFEYVHDAFKYGAYDYLLKPVEPDKMKELFTRIHDSLIKMHENGDHLNLPPKKIRGDKMVHLIDQHIRKNLGKDNSIVQVCNYFMISQPYLSRIFKQYKNCTYNEYLIHLKIEKAKELLQTGGHLIGEVADALGFSDQFYFSKVFKNTVGCTPREYVKQHMQG